MSNSLNITLTEFKTRNREEVICGYIAQDDHCTVCMRVSSTWELFKKEFPSREDILQSISQNDGFNELMDDFKVVDGEITPEEDGPYSYISFEGDDGIY
ncbi:hypothetical protein ACI2KR_27300 [Pseudomonas luteola]